MKNFQINTYAKNYLVVAAKHHMINFFLCISDVYDMMVIVREISYYSLKSQMFIREFVNTTILN